MKTLNNKPTCIHTDSHTQPAKRSNPLKCKENTITMVKAMSTDYM